MALGDPGVGHAAGAGHLEQKARAVPVLDGLVHKGLGVGLATARPHHGGRGNQLVLRAQLEVLPLGGIRAGELFIERGLDMDRGRAGAALERQQRLGNAAQALDHGAIALGQGLGEVAALRHAGHLAAQVFPALDAAGLGHQGAAADQVIGRGREREDLAALLRPLDVGDQQVHLAALQELHARGGRHGNRLQRHAQAARDVGGQLGLVAAGLAGGGVQHAERRAGTVDAHGQLAALLDLVQRGIGVGGTGAQQQGQGGGKGGKKAGHA